MPHGKVQGARLKVSSEMVSLTPLMDACCKIHPFPLAFESEGVV